MTASDINAIGYIAQGLFAARFLIQWISSEKAKRVVAPLLFWQISLIASALLIVYSILIKDMTILIGQFFGYFIYVRNLRLQKSWRTIPVYLRIIILWVPLQALLLLLIEGEYSFFSTIENHQNSLIFLWGLLGQFIFSTRFLYQWYYSEKIKKSTLPLGFWTLSIFGSVLIASYAFLHDFYPILIGHLFGLTIYSRNLVLHFKAKENTQ